MSLETPSDELGRLEKKSTVVLADDQPLERPAEKIEKGPLYAGIEEREQDVADLSLDNSAEQGEQAASTVGRRDLMKLFSASAVLGASACVRRPTEHVIPYAEQPKDMAPGIPNYYATTCGECPAGCSVVAKTREGRPVKLEGQAGTVSPEGVSLPLNDGALCSLGQGSLQGVFHPERLKGPMMKHGLRMDQVSWEEIYETLAARFQDGARVAIFTGGSTGHQAEFYTEVLEKFGGDASDLYQWEPHSLSVAIGQAHEIAFGERLIPRADLAKTKLIVSVGSDFLDVGTHPVAMSKAFAKGIPYQSGNKGQLVHFESGLTLTGSKATRRHVMAPGGEAQVLLGLIRSLLAAPNSKGSTEERRIAQGILDSQAGTLGALEKVAGLNAEGFDKLAADLIAKPALILAGGASGFDATMTQVQLLALLANALVGSYESVLDIKDSWLNAPAGAGDVQRFFTKINDYDTVFFINTNPATTLPESFGFAQAIEKVKTVISMQAFPNETDAFADFVLAGHHYLESWGDERPVRGTLAVRQPIVRATTDSRQAEDVFLWVLAHLKTPLPYKDYRTYLRGKWKLWYDRMSPAMDYDLFYKDILRRGLVASIESGTQPTMTDFRAELGSLPTAGTGLTLLAPLDVRLRDGRGAHLPVLQEVGDPLTTVTWDSWVVLSVETCKKLGVRRNDLVRLEGPGGSVEVAVFPMPGIHPDAAILPRGNGFDNSMSKVSRGVGVNPLKALSQTWDLVSSEPVTSGQGVKLTKTGKRYKLAAMQKHADIGNRTDIVKRMSLETAKAREGKTVDVDTVPDIYPELPVGEYKWGMSVDLEKCTGCGSCMTACTIENNIPQVGRDQVNLGREMHWIRLDRYFHGEVSDPQVTFQPVMCQQCNHAPCEAVCPVFATTHHPEGINQMTYNRCVGTRYCANACPYKVRRFNWWTHKWGEIGDSQIHRNPRPLNPDVTVRTRGVMEKCNFCVGRIRDAKHRIKELNRDGLTRGGQAFVMADEDLKTACQQTCPSDAIEFGNLLNENSQVSSDRKNQRSYLMLGGDPEHKHYGIKTLPSVNYLAEVREDLGGGAEHH